MSSTSNLPGEFELIARHFAPLAKGFPGAYGLLDDVAVISPTAGHELVAKTDAIICGVHFLPDDLPDLIARKALRVNLSDLAGKGATPRAYMLNIMLPNSINEAWIATFVRGLAQDQDEYAVYLIGGDTNSTPGPLSIAITAFGEVSTDRLLRRNGARVGDTIFVTGTIGDSALGLRVLHGALPTLDPRSAAFLASRYRLPLPRVTVGPRLIGLATAAIDVSDGLMADLRHICEVSGLAAAVEAPRVPLSAAGRAATSISPECLAAALTGGDDYEILFTAPPESETTLAELSRMVGVLITPIGRMVTPSAGDKSLVSVLDATGRPLLLSREGWTHF